MGLFYAPASIVKKDQREVHEATPLGNRREDKGIYQHDMHGLLDDLFSTLPMEGNNADTSEGEENTSLNTERVKNDGTKSNDLLKDVEQEQQVIFHVARVKVCLVAMVTNSISRSKRVL
ncbi:hypothetical protein Tco_1421343 [Tanacetum coccineum]